MENIISYVIAVFTIIIVIISIIYLNNRHKEKIKKINCEINNRLKEKNRFALVCSAISKLPPKKIKINGELLADYIKWIKPFTAITLRSSIIEEVGMVPLSYEQRIFISKLMEDTLLKVFDIEKFSEIYAQSVYGRIQQKETKGVEDFVQSLITKETSLDFANKVIARLEKMETEAFTNEKKVFYSRAINRVKKENS